MTQHQLSRFTGTDWKTGVSSTSKHSTAFVLRIDPILCYGFYSALVDRDFLPAPRSSVCCFVVKFSTRCGHVTAAVTHCTQAEDSFCPVIKYGPLNRNVSVIARSGQHLVIRSSIGHFQSIFYTQERLLSMMV